MIKTIYCCGCEKKVNARLTDGEEIYPYRQDLYSLPFWKCDRCGNYVGCHHKDKNNPTNPLGVIPTKELMNARRHIHLILDPIWQSGTKKRAVVYAELSKRLGWNYHTANLKNIDEARKVYKMVRELASETRNNKTSR